MLCGAVGACLIAVAAGLVYIDMREHRQSELRLIAGGMTKQEARQQLHSELPDARIIVTALIAGAIGSASFTYAALSTAWRFCDAISQRKSAST